MLKLKYIITELKNGKAFQKNEIEEILKSKNPLKISEKIAKNRE